MSSGSPTRNGTSVEPGLEKIVVSPSRAARRTSLTSRRRRACATARHWIARLYTAKHLVFVCGGSAVSIRPAWHASARQRPRRHLAGSPAQRADRAGDPALPGGAGPAARRPHRHRAAAGRRVRRQPPDAARGAAAAGRLAPDPRRPRALRRRSSSRTRPATDEPQPQRVDRADARHREHHDGRPARRAHVARGAAGPARRRERRRAEVDARWRSDRRRRGPRARQPTFNDADTRFHQTLAEAVGNELLLAFTGWTLDVLQPSLIVADRRPRQARGHPRPAPRDLRAVRPPPAPGGASRRCRRTSSTCTTCCTDRAAPAPDHGSPSAAAAARTRPPAACTPPARRAQLPLLDPAHAAAAERDRHAERDAGHPVLALEQHRGGPQLLGVAGQRGDHPRHAVAGRPGRGAPGVQRHVAPVPAAQEVLRLLLLRGRERDRLAADAHPVSSGTQPSPCSPSTHASTASERTPSASPTAVRSAAVVGGVAEDAPAVEAGVHVSQVHSGSTGLVTTITTPGQSPPQRLADVAHDLGVAAQVDHARPVDRQRHAGADDDHVGAGRRRQVDDPHRAGGAGGDHLLEVHLVRARHARAARRPAPPRRARGGRAG